MVTATSSFEPGRVAREVAREALRQRPDATIAIDVRPSVPRAVAGDAKPLLDVLGAFAERMLASSPALVLSVVPGESALHFELEARSPITRGEIDALLDPSREPALASAFARATTAGLDASFDAVPGKSFSLALGIPLVAASPRAATALETQRVLVVDDDPSVRRLLALLLRQVARTEECGDGADAKARVLAAWDEGAPFGLVLLDMELPRLDGYGVARELRAAGSHVPIVALTARGFYGDRERCFEAGCDDYVAKPVRRAELFAAIHRVAPRALVPPEPDERELARLATGFGASLARRVDDLARAAFDGRLDEARRIAHQLRGAAGGFGFSAVGEAATFLERALAAARASLVPVGLERLASAARDADDDAHDDASRGARGAPE